jgi:chromosome segregation protein
MLSALELNGFKSFADRTRLEFPRGITVVVGPNGSGKSNVVDAIKWVLGSQSAKSLRGKEMTDVIFGGSRSRRQANAAEASIVLDNSTGLIDHDAREIQITRRVYRSGEGEYLINRQPCRLRDVRDLLASAGISTGGYAIIEQGRVDAMLQASPAERRVLFEEAAGIARFRVKREEAARRLERVQQNLLRLGDIVGELQSRLKTVRAQAARAQRHNELAEQVRVLRTQLGRDDWRRLSQQIEAEETAAARQETAAADCSARLAECEQGIAACDAQLEQLGIAQREALAAEASLRERLAQCESTRSSHLARIDELEQEVVRLSHQLLTLTSRAGDSQQLVADTTDDLEKSQLDLGVLKTRLAETDAELARGEAELAEAVRQADEAEAALDESHRELTQLQAAHQLSEVKRQAAEAALAASEDEAAPLVEVRDRLAAEASRVGAEAGGLARQLDEASRELQAAQAELDLDRAKLAAAHKRVAELHGRLSGASERIAVLEELEAQLDGLTSGAKAVLRRAADEPDGPFRGVRGVVADLLHVDADTAPLVEIALGERANHLVVTDTGTLAAALAEETSAWPGRTTFLRLDVPHPASAIDRIDLASEPGVMGRADQFVESVADLGPLVRRLLGRHWLVDRLPTALRLASGVGRGLNFITVAGEAVLADGTLAVGPRQSVAGMLSRRSELRALRDEIETLKTTAADSQRDAEVLESRIGERAAAARQLAAKHAEVGRLHGEARLRAAAVSERAAQAEVRLNTLTAERAAVVAQLAELSQQRTGVADHQRELEAAAAASRAAAAAATEAQQRLSAEIAARQRVQTEQRVELARREQRVEGLLKQMDQLARDHAERDRALVETRARATQCQAQRESLQHSVKALAAEAADLAVQRERVAHGLTEVDSARRTCQVERTAAQSSAEAARSLAVAVQARLQAARLQIQQSVQLRTTAAERLHEDYGIDLAALAGNEADASSVSAAPIDRAAIEAEIRDLRERLQAAGPVNLESLAELEQLEGRSGGLVAQYEDLEQARQRLEQVTEQINGESRELFTAAVEEVRGHFQEIFSKLFAGGEADIVLEPDASGDILDCGVTIIARPPGKQPRNISLLSGGERTLTCVALLMAIFRSRPSPFCVLDEVDAALDEANIDRFVKLLQEFQSTTQFLVVTHSKRTMTCAHTLHGVTMQDSGVSKRVSVRFEDVGEDGRIRTSALRAEGPTGADGESGLARAA